MGKKKIILYILILFGQKAYSTNTDKLAISTSKVTVLIFPEKVEDVSLGNKTEYHIGIQDRCILLRAKTPKAQSTSIFVQYGTSKKIYIGEIFADKNAPLRHDLKIENTNSNLQKTSIQITEKKKEHKTEKNTIWKKGAEQEYTTYGDKKGRVSVILTNLAVSKEHLYLRIFVKNNSSIHLNLTEYRFDYIDYLVKFLGIGFKKKKEEVGATIYPESIQLDSKKHGYYEFAIPAKPINGRLEIHLSEENNERNFIIKIPAKKILKAKNI